MPCKYCGQYPHHNRCPLAPEPKFDHYCSYCGEGIYEGEEYIENGNGEFRHYDCFQGICDLLEWLGYKIKTMEND